MANPPDDVSGDKVHQTKMWTAPSHVEAHLEKLRNTSFNNSLLLCFAYSWQKYDGDHGEEDEDNAEDGVGLRQVTAALWIDHILRKVHGNTFNAIITLWNNRCKMFVAP